MNREADGVIVWLDCSHKLDPRFGCSKKTRTLYRADPPVFVENSVVFGDSKDVSVCVDKSNKTQKNCID